MSWRQELKLYGPRSTPFRSTFAIDLLTAWTKTDYNHFHYYAFILHTASLPWHDACNHVQRV